MAGSKRTTRSRTGTKRATASKSTKKSTAKRSTAAKTSTNSKVRSRRAEADNFRDNYDPSLILFLSIVIISVIYYFLVANAGDGIGIIGTFFFGMFGYMAYVFPVALIAGYLLNVNNRSVLIGNIKSFCVGLMFIVLCTYSQLFTGDNKEIESLKDYYIFSAEYRNGGGATGGLIHSVFRDFSGGSIWCFLLLLILFILCFVGITGKQFVKDSKEFIVEFIENLKDGYYDDQERREERFERGLAKRENRLRKAEEKKEFRRERRRQREEIQEERRRRQVVKGVMLDTKIEKPDTDITRLKTTMPTPDEYGLNKTSEEIISKITKPDTEQELKAKAAYINAPLRTSFDNVTAYSQIINMEPINQSDNMTVNDTAELSDTYYNNQPDSYEAESDEVEAAGNFVNDTVSEEVYIGADNGIKIKTLSSTSSGIVTNSDSSSEIRPVGGTRTYEERTFTGPNVDKVTTDGESLNPWSSKNNEKEINSEQVSENTDSIANKDSDNVSDNNDLIKLISIPLEDKEKTAHEGLFSSSPNAMKEIRFSYKEEKEDEKSSDDDKISIDDFIAKDNETALETETDENNDTSSVSKISIKRDPHINAFADDSLRREHRIHILDEFLGETDNSKSSHDNALNHDEIKSSDLNTTDDKDTVEPEEDVLKTLDRTEKTDIFEALKQYDNNKTEEKHSDAKSEEKEKSLFFNSDNDDLFRDVETSDEKIVDEEEEDFDILRKFNDKVADKDEEIKNKTSNEEAISDINFSGINKPGNSFNNIEEEEEKEALKTTSFVQKMPQGKYIFPPIDLLREGKPNENMETEEELHETAADLQRTLKTFGVNVEMKEINQGPSITRFEMMPEEGTKVSKITKLADDIKLNMAAKDVRIEAPIPGKRAVGIELPNKETTPVVFRELVDTDTFKEASSKVSFAVGKSLTGETVVTDIAKMPHVLIAGTTGSGKSVCINTLIMSILYKAKPDEVKLILVDPKVVELSIYNGIPHLLIPVVTDPKKAAAALNWACVEMDDRYQKFADYGVRNLKGYNEKIAKMTDVPVENRPEKMYQMVVVVDELADLMMVASKDVEDAICRLAQKARACGIHLVIATQRPSVDVITGLIKANFPSRIAFAVNSVIDSRTILDSAGAERLLGKGDMLFAPQGQKPERLQGAFIDDDEVTAVVDFLKENSGEQYNDEVIAKVEAQSNAANASADAGKAGGASDDTGMDELFVDVAKFCIERDKASASVIQRKFRLGWNRAARIMDQLYDAGIISGEEGTKPRRVLVSMEEFENGLEQGEY